MIVFFPFVLTYFAALWTPLFAHVLEKAICITMTCPEWLYYLATFVLDYEKHVTMRTQFDPNMG